MIEMYCLYLWRLQTPGSRCSKIQCLVVLPSKMVPCCCTLVDVRAAPHLIVSFRKALSYSWDDTILSRPYIVI